ncbi:prophage pi2 protein 40 [Bacillus thuringiensis serovar israelensis ATCC 35646]|nr:prophage pi2 protein 40 [Bacillus thuringiensis serovar israelensis ATCC 35646]
MSDLVGYTLKGCPEIPDRMTWLEGLMEFPIYDIMPEINEMVQKTMGAKKK